MFFKKAHPQKRGVLPPGTPERLQTQFDFYDQGSSRHLKKFQRWKVIQLIAGAAIPVAAIVIPTDARNNSVLLRGATAALGGIVASIESYVQFRQFHQNWIRWRTAAEALRREANLYAVKAGTYKNSETPEVMLAENVEDIVAVEQQSWRSVQENPHPPRDAGGTQVKS